MSRHFLISIKVVSFILGLGYIVFLILPLVGSMIFTIGLGTVSNKLSIFHLVSYSAVLFSILVLYILFRIYKSDEGGKILRLFLSVLLVIGMFHFSLKLVSDYQKKTVEDSKLRARQEKELYIQEHCNKVSEVNGRIVYECDDGSIR